MAEPPEKNLSEKIRTALGETTRLVSLAPLAGDASSRRYYRAQLESAAAPASLIVMQFTDSSLPLSSEELSIFREPPKELPFLDVHRLFTQIHVRVPALYGAWPEEGIILLEDLGDRSLWDSVQGLPAGEILPWYEKALDQLLLIHLEGTRRQQAVSCIAFRQRFDFRLYMWEFDHFIEYGLRRQGGKIGDGDKTKLRESFEEMARGLAGLPPCLSHRDYHSWNLMVRDGQVAVIDFQDALLAPPQYDLASLLNDRETDRIIRPDLENHLVRYYLQKREEMGGKRANRDEFLEGYILSALQRDFKVVGRFHYLDRVKGKPGYKKYIPPTLKRLRRNLDRVPRYKSLLPILAAEFEEFQ
jgi:aminoglycoside/choline kinase family phosphotransferase